MMVSKKKCHDPVFGWKMRQFKLRISGALSMVASIVLSLSTASVATPVILNSIYERFLQVLAGRTNCSGGRSLLNPGLDCHNLLNDN